jgi:hypothetical protein
MPKWYGLQGLIIIIITCSKWNLLIDHNLHMHTSPPLAAAAIATATEPSTQPKTPLSA